MVPAVIPEPSSDLVSAEFFLLIQKASLPGIWSKAVSLIRTSQSVLFDSLKEGEIQARVRTSDHPVSRKVSLWPQDEDWFCDCNAKTEVCMHVIATLLTLKNKPQQVLEPEKNSKVFGALLYQFSRDPQNKDRLLFHRWIKQGDQKTLLSGSLVARVGGVQSGRVQAPPLSVTQSDYAIDGILNDKHSGDLDPLTLKQLIKGLAECSNIFLDDEAISTSAKPLELKAELLDEERAGQWGYRLRLIGDQSVTEKFKNGAVLCQTAGQAVLKAVELPPFSDQEKALLAGHGTFFPPSEKATLLTEILPKLEKKITITQLTRKLPRIEKIPPRIVLSLEQAPFSQTGPENSVTSSVTFEEVLCVVPKIVYEPETKTQNSTSDLEETLYLPDPSMEKALIRKLQTELQLNPGQVVYFKGAEAVDFCLKLKGWETQGKAQHQFTLSETLSPQFEAYSKGCSLSFIDPVTQKKADFSQVFQAWRENKNYVPLLGGGWAPLPKDWLARYGDRISQLLSMRDQNAELPSYMMTEVIRFCDETAQSYPDTLKTLREKIHQIDQISEAPLPLDLNATLRHYQQTGVNWLTFLRNLKMGALLADDMGLGKTLQALCVIQKKTLVIAPTSVLHSWQTQIQEFRPGLSVSSYYGPNRKLDTQSDLILTTYAILRLDCALLAQVKWNTVLLDEAQTIKNPESQVTRAAHSLQAEFKIALSGTPVENSLKDLWSQFQFLNPGLLGSLETFEEQFSDPISRGDTTATQQLKQRIKPFILRRMKKEVTPELPPKTEITLYSELNENERELYDSLLATTRKEVLENLGTGKGGLFSILELLLRLRQACCHSALIPGQNAEQSSKIELLLETLERSLSQGHRALVFSQWTSLLDLIEPEFIKRGITYSRLDGSTKNRGDIVTDFQKEDGPSVLLISLKAGGVGLNLTAADHLFLMDPWWNPAVEDQATDRAHRIGQSNPVLIHRIIAQNTIEERIVTLQKSKIQLMTAVLENASASSSLSREDLLMLLS